MTRHRPPVVVKLGGSVLTDKARERTLQREALERLAEELASVRRPLVVLHGAGSFGHVLARKHRLHEGRLEDDPEQVPGLARVRADVGALHQAVLDALLDAGLPAVGLPAYPLADLRSGALASLRTDPFRRSLALGLVPVSHGDVAPDEDRGFGIVSGDALAQDLARALRPALVVFATDVEGVLRDGTVVPRLTAQGLRDLAPGGSDHPDVTGGMAGKARHMARIARGGVPVRVVDGTVPGRVAGAIDGRDVTGTLIAEGGT